MLTSPSALNSASLRTPSLVVQLSALPDYDEPVRAPGEGDHPESTRLWQLENRAQDLKNSLQRALSERHEALRETDLLRVQNDEALLRLTALSTEFEAIRQQNAELRAGQLSDRAAFAALQREHEQARLNWMTESIKVQKQSRKADDYGDEERALKKQAVNSSMAQEGELEGPSIGEREELLSVIRRMAHELDYANCARERLEKKLQSLTLRLREESTEREEIHAQLLAESAMAKRERFRMQAEIDQLMQRLKLTIGTAEFHLRPPFIPACPPHDRSVSRPLSPPLRRRSPPHMPGRIY